MGEKNKCSFPLDIFLVALAAKVGATGTIIIGLLLFFIFKGTTQQHAEFIDKFFLLKTTGAHYYLSYGIIFLVILLFYQYFYFKRRLGIANEKIKELKKERDKLKRGI